MFDRYYIVNKFTGKKRTTGMMGFSKALFTIAKIQEEDATPEELALYNRCLSEGKSLDACGLRAKWAKRCIFVMVERHEYAKRWPSK